MAKMANFSRIRRDDGSFLVDDIPFDCEETIKIYGEDGTLMGLLFSVPGKGTCISEYWTKEESQMGHFHIMSLWNGFRFPLSSFILEVLNDYGIAPS